LAGFLISFAPRVRSSNKQVFKSSIKSKQPQEILCKADVLLFWRKHSGLVFIANTIINTVELKVDFLYTTGRYHIIFKILGRFNFNKLSNCVCNKIQCLYSNYNIFWKLQMRVLTGALWKPGMPEYHGIRRNMTEYHGICRNITEYGGISRNITTFSRNIAYLDITIFFDGSHATVYKHRRLTTYFDYKSDGSFPFWR
jgi:hypothetical protein